jgi:hypothetical protein
VAIHRPPDRVEGEQRGAPGLSGRHRPDEKTATQRRNAMGCTHEWPQFYKEQKSWNGVSKGYATRKCKKCNATQTKTLAEAGFSTSVNWF